MTQTIAFVLQIFASEKCWKITKLRTHFSIYFSLFYDSIFSIAPSVWNWLNFSNKVCVFQWCLARWEINNVTPLQYMNIHPYEHHPSIWTYFTALRERERGRYTSFIPLFSHSVRDLTCIRPVSFNFTIVNATRSAQFQRKKEKEFCKHLPDIV